MADRCNISNYFLRDTKRKLAIPLPQKNVKKVISLGTKNKNGLEGSSKMVFCLTKQGFPEMTGFCLKQSQGLKASAA